jgi:mannitol/fructose-specific phosphotransferase system IIA component (Ntr-type)
LLLDPQLIFLDIPAHTREEVLVWVADRLEEVGAVRRAGDLVDLLLDRERLGATVVGEETAIPHCKLPGMKEIVTAFARTTEPIAFGADDELARMFFFVVSPREQPAAHLQVLANISRLLRSAEARRVLATAPDAAAIRGGLAALETRP